jgi:hypothetical protein
MADSNAAQVALGASTGSEPANPASGPKTSEIVVIFKPDAGVKTSIRGLVKVATHEPHPIQAILEPHGASLRPLFGPTEERVRQLMRRMEGEAASTSGVGEEATTEPRAAPSQDLSLFYHTHVPAQHAEDTRKLIFADKTVAAAYINPPADVPLFSVPQPAPADAPAVTPNFLDRQGYLNPAPAGIDAKLAWTIPGGTGTGVRITDCEWGWRFTHEDLLANQAGVVAGASASEPTIETNPPDDTAHRIINHGTAVIGVISGDANAFGITGITPDAVISASSFQTQSVPTAITAAADKLSAGDVILLEIHQSGPNSPNPPPFPGDQHGYIAVEWWPANFAAIQYAVNKGIVVVEAAGNGFQNLDDPSYDTPQAGFPSDWKNPFRTGGPDSGAIMVGAGAPPPGTHSASNSWGPDRSRLDFSNYGSRIDAQGWGQAVTSTGYGDLQGGLSKDIWYTDTFNGTSSASPIVTGAVVSMQGALRARGRRRLSPNEARLLLRSIGSPQQDNAPSSPLSQRIGKRPNLRTLIPAAAKLQCRSADLDRDGRAEVLVASPDGITLLKSAAGSAFFQASAGQRNNTRIGGWLLNTADNSLGPVADYDGDGAAETLIVSPWGIGLLKHSGSSVACPYLQANGSFIAAGWRLDTHSNCFGPAADLDGDGAAELLVSSPWGLGVIKYAGGGGGGVMTAPLVVPNGVRFAGPAGQSWLLNTADDEFGPAGDFNGDGHVELLVVSPWGIGVAQYHGGGANNITMLAMAPNGTRIAGPGGQSWLLNTSDNRFGPVGDYDGDGHAEVLVTSPWGLAVLKLVGSGFTASAMAANGTRFAAQGGSGGSWLLNTKDNQFMFARRFLPGRASSLLVTSPWGVGVLAQAGGTLACQLLSQNGTRFPLAGNAGPGSGWLLNTTNDWLGSAADFDGDGMAEILVSSPWGVGCLKLQAAGRMIAIAMQANGAVGTWTLDTAADDFGHGV